jgi:hypothetical protein
MQTRIIYTNFWINSIQENLSLESQHLYIYLLTCPYIGICSVFRLPDQYILLESKLSLKQLADAKLELTKKNKVRFYDGWVYVVKAEKFVNYKKSPKNQVCYLKEVSFIPDVVISNLSYSIDSTIDSSKDTSYKSGIINQESGIRNQKSNTLVKTLAEKIADDVEEGLNSK